MKWLFQRTTIELPALREEIDASGRRCKMNKSSLIGPRAFLSRYYSAFETIVVIRALRIVCRETQDESRSDFIILGHSSERAPICDAGDRFKLSSSSSTPAEGKSARDFLAQEIAFKLRGGDNKVPPPLGKSCVKTMNRWTFLCSDVSPLFTPLFFLDLRRNHFTISRTRPQPRWILVQFVGSLDARATGSFCNVGDCPLTATMS